MSLAWKAQCCQDACSPGSNLGFKVNPNPIPEVPKEIWQTVENVHRSVSKWE